MTTRLFDITLKCQVEIPETDRATKDDIHKVINYASENLRQHLKTLGREVQPSGFSQSVFEVFRHYER